MQSRKIRNFYFGVLQTRLGLLLSKMLRTWVLLRSEPVAIFQKVRAIWRSREFVNFTYNLCAPSRDYLPYSLATITNCSVADAERFVREVENDGTLAKYHHETIEASGRRWSSDAEFKPGRLLLPYALVRLTKPRFVFEAGLDKGFGSIVLNRALGKNKNEGYDADYLGVEYRSDRPAFLFENYPDKIGRCEYASWGDVFAKCGKGSIDFMFYDAVAYPEELEKLVTYADRFSDHAIIISPWSFIDFYKIAERIGRNVTMFHAQPKNHWFDGAELCVMYRKTVEPLIYQSGNNGP